MNKIALYSCNFGNYRNEFDYYNNVVFDNNIDYFLFTDKNVDTLNLGRWNIINPPLIPADEVMDSFRWSSKHVKFILPEILNSYEIIVWVDNKRFQKNDKMNNISYELISKILNMYPESNVFNLKHQKRNNIQEEIRKTISVGSENRDSAVLFYNNIRCYKSSFGLPDTCVIIRKNIPNVNKAFEKCFEYLKIHKLKRDQNIYNYALDNEKITPILLNYKDMSFI